MEEITLTEIENFVIDADPNLDMEEEAFKAAVILLSSAVFGTDIDTLAAFTGLPYNLIGKFADNLERSGVWKDGAVYHSGWDNEGMKGVISFWLDVAIATGHVIRLEGDRYAATRTPDSSCD